LPNEPLVASIVEAALLPRGWRLRHPAVRGVLRSPSGEVLRALLAAETNPHGPREGRDLAQLRHTAFSAVDNDRVSADAAWWRRRRRRVPASAVPAGIYGTIICASILASSDGERPVKVAVVHRHAGRLLAG
jgi:hypothetical protein